MLKKLLKIILWLIVIALAIPVLVLLIGFIGALFTAQVHFFLPVEIGSIPVGKPYTHSFCEPALRKTSDVCGAAATSPSNGTPPYRFGLQPGADFHLPNGLVLHPNGLLIGTPTVRGKYHFGVCVLDADDKQRCDLTTLTVIDR